MLCDRCEESVDDFNAEYRIIGVPVVSAAIGWLSHRLNNIVFIPIELLSE